MNPAGDSYFSSVTSTISSDNSASTLTTFISSPTDTISLPTSTNAYLPETYGVRALSKSFATTLADIDTVPFDQFIHYYDLTFRNGTARQTKCIGISRTPISGTTNFEFEATSAATT